MRNLTLQDAGGIPITLCQRLRAGYALVIFSVVQELIPRSPALARNNQPRPEKTYKTAVGPPSGHLALLSRPCTPKDPLGQRGIPQFMFPVMTIDSCQACGDGTRTLVRRRSIRLLQPSPNSLSGCVWLFVVDRRPSHTEMTEASPIMALKAFRRVSSLRAESELPWESMR